MFTSVIMLGQDKKIDSLSAVGQYKIGSDYLFSYTFEGEKNNDKDKAIYWLTKSAKKDNKDAQLNLGRLYYNIGNYEKAIYWLMKPAKQGHSWAQYKLGHIYKHDWRHIIRKDESVLDCWGKSFYWYKKSLDNGMKIASYELKDLKFRVCTSNTNKNEKKDFLCKKLNFWYGKYRFEELAKLGSRFDQFKLAEVYYERGGEENYKKAFYWFKKSAEAGCELAQNNLALMYDTGKGTLTDKKKAFYWLKKSAESCAIAQRNLGIAYLNGKGTAIDKKKAAYWIRTAYNHGDKGAKKIWEEEELWKYEN